MCHHHRPRHRHCHPRRARLQSLLHKANLTEIEVPWWQGGTCIGDVFTMEMTYEDEDGVEHYRTDNYITELAADGVIEWEVAPHGKSRLGWRWRYELRANGAVTNTTLVYDWSRTRAENLQRYGAPLFDQHDLADSLALLAAAMS